jgi:hypothetical protein
LRNKTGNPIEQISLDDLKAKAKGANPFEIPETNRTPEQEKQIRYLGRAKFAAGFKMQMGMPPGVSPKDLDIVTLGSSASNVKFKMFCSQITVVQLGMDYDYDNDTVSWNWNVYNQPHGQPWSIQTNVSWPLGVSFFKRWSAMRTISLPSLRSSIVSSLTLARQANVKTDI